MNNDWTNIEVALIVSDYFSMLEDELLGNPINKTLHRNGLKKLLKGIDILFTDLVPDTTVTSVREWIYAGMGEVPVPEDSGASILLDMDRDDLPDMRFSVGTSYQWVSASNPEANYNFSSWLSMIRDPDSVAGHIYHEYCSVALPFLPDSIISSSCEFAPHVLTYHPYTPNSFCFCNTFTGDTYYGFKLSGADGTHFGWVLTAFDYAQNRLVVKEFAINNAAGRSIRAGQKEWSGMILITNFNNKQYNNRWEYQDREIGTLY
jgi:hypothetical protein